MAGGTNDASGRMMSFVSEKEVVEMRKKRQEQWERVRKPGEPKERPVEAYDPRPLYERLKEQREKEDEIREEKFKLKNMIYKGLDDEEAGFLNNVAYQQTRRDQLLIQKERDEINAFREAVLEMNAVESEQKLAQPLKSIPLVKKGSNVKSKQSLMAGTLVRKRSSSETGTDSTSASSDNMTTTSHEKKLKLSTKDDSTILAITAKPIVSTNTQILPKNSSGLASLTSYNSSSSDDEDN